MAEESTAADQSMHRFGAKTLWPTRGSVSSLGCLRPLVRCVLHREFSGTIHVITFAMSSSQQPYVKRTSKSSAATFVDLSIVVVDTFVKLRRLMLEMTGNKLFLVVRIITGWW